LHKEFKDIYCDIYVEESERRTPLRENGAYMGLCGGERERKEGERERETSVRQNHSTSTPRPLDKHSTPIDRHFLDFAQQARSYDRSVHPKSLSE
jgi:hypothetical protein